MFKYATNNELLVERIKRGKEAFYEILKAKKKAEEEYAKKKNKNEYKKYEDSLDDNNIYVKEIKCYEYVLDQLNNLNMYNCNEINENSKSLLALAKTKCIFVKSIRNFPDEKSGCILNPKKLNKLQIYLYNNNMFDQFQNENIAETLSLDELRKIENTKNPCLYGTDPNEEYPNIAGKLPLKNNENNYNIYNNSDNSDEYNLRYKHNTKNYYHNNNYIPNEKESNNDININKKLCENLKYKIVTNCTGNDNMSDTAFQIYHSELNHIDDICFYIQSIEWNKRTEENIFAGICLKVFITTIISKNENNSSNNINTNTTNNNDNTDVSIEDKFLYSTYRNEEIMEILPLSFIINIKNYDWETRLRKSHKSLYILIINFTRQTLVLPDIKKGKSSVLTDGNWVEFPSEKIASLRCSEFGCNNDGMFSSINGYCKYKFMNESCYLNIFWDINNVNSTIKCNIKNTTKYTIIKNVEIYNECTAVFHILEYYYYPPIKLLECRALTNNIINNYGINKNNIDENMNIIYQCSISVIRQFCQYLHNNAQQENNTNCDLLNMSCLKTLMNDDYSDNLRNKNIFSPDFSKSNKIISVYSNEVDNDNSYLNDLNDKKNVTLDNDTIDYTGNEDFRRNIHDHNLHLLRKKRNVNSNSLCYINRKNIFTNINITAARDFFCYMHGNNYSNNIPINSYLYISWNIGNIIYRNLYNSSENIIINAHSLLSSHNINDDVILKLKIDENNRRIYPSHLIQNLLMNVKSDIYINNECVVLDIILNIFHILSAHLSPIIEQIMEMEYGDRWLIDSKIPKSNIWEKSKGKNELDIEGIIHILTTFWMDIFENRIKNIMILENLQKASIFWANQEIDQFDQEFFLSNLVSSYFFSFIYLFCSFK
ncbi:hypothetical protein [Plasmodium yoelii yoelii]|uniref:Uncharacterized protein n=1 Tax=Plasmodium yoelii yoelii TaxID=73239 RepID=Q7RR95_PLAYO|nr:hypothetical protein [Plasmodium yoelii yoelii]